MSRTKQPNAARARRLPVPLAGFGALLFLSLSLRCGGRAAETKSVLGHGGASAGKLGGAGAGRPSIIVPAGGGGASAQGGSAPGQGGTTAMGGAPACSAAAFESECQLPPSTCATDGHTLNYYTATCPAGQCVYATQSYPCMGECVNGACLASSTTTSSSPPVPPCTTDAGAGGQGCDAGPPCVTAADCSIPASTCVDAHTLGYYVVQCVNRQCTIELQPIQCAGGCFGSTCEGVPTK